MTHSQMLDALVQAVKNWRLRVQAGPEHINGVNYTPVKRNVSILRFVTNLDGGGMDDPQGLLDEMKRIINHPNFERMTFGWVRGLEQHAPEALWEWLIMDRTTAFAPLWTNAERAIVARSVANTYKTI